MALYFRQILIMLVSLYTVRVVLNTLGAEDYGIFNVVAGVVVLFSFVNNAMATSVQRFLNFYLGKNDTEKTRNVYSASLVIHGVICLIFIVLAETAGLWFVNAKLNIPSERSNAAFWCYQAAVVTTFANIMRVPYNAVIIAYEKMSFFAGLSIVEAILKLAVVFLLKIAQFDKLIFYSFLLLWLIVLPLSLNLETVLTLWLKNVPGYSVVFVQLILICSLVDCMTYPIAVAVQASGNIKFYQIIISCFIFANLPLSILFLLVGMPPYSVLFIRFFLCLLILVFRVVYLNFSQSFPAKKFIFQVLLRCAVIVALSFFITKLLTSHLLGLSYFLCSCLFSIFIIFVLSFLLLFTSEERKYAFSFIKRIRR